LIQIRIGGLIFTFRGQKIDEEAQQFEVPVLLWISRS